MWCLPASADNKISLARANEILKEELAGHHVIDGRALCELVASLLKQGLSGKSLTSSKKSLQNAIMTSAVWQNVQPLREDEKQKIIHDFLIDWTLLSLASHRLEQYDEKALRPIYMAVAFRFLQMAGESFSQEKQIEVAQAMKAITSQLPTSQKILNEMLESSHHIQDNIKLHNSLYKPDGSYRSYLTQLSSPVLATFYVVGLPALLAGSFLLSPGVRGILPFWPNFPLTFLAMTPLSAIAFVINVFTWLQSDRRQILKPLEPWENTCSSVFTAPE